MEDHAEDHEVLAQVIFDTGRDLTIGRLAEMIQRLGGDPGLVERLPAARAFLEGVDLNALAARGWGTRYVPSSDDLLIRHKKFEIQRDVAAALIDWLTRSS
jgi:nucleoside-diphosphate-sugar epimerase